MISISGSLEGGIRIESMIWEMFEVGKLEWKVVRLALVTRRALNAKSKACYRCKMGISRYSSAQK